MRSAAIVLKTMYMSLFVVYVPTNRRAYQQTSMNIAELLGLRRKRVNLTILANPSWSVIVPWTVSLSPSGRIFIVVFSAR